MRFIRKMLFIALGFVIITEASFATDVINNIAPTNTMPSRNPIAQTTANPDMQTTVVSVPSTEIIPSDADTKLIAAIYAKYSKAAALIGTSLTVNCLHGYVTISGTVVAQSQADEAVIAAKSVPGVKNVTSQISVKTNPKVGGDANAPSY